MEYLHNQKNVRHSPRKLRLVTDMIRRMNPEQAVETLKFINRAAALDLAKAIKASLANVGKDKELTFKKIEINEGVKIARVRAGSRGRANPYKRRFSHIKIVLTDEGGK